MRFIYAFVLIAAVIFTGCESVNGTELPEPVTVTDENVTDEEDVTYTPVYDYDYAPEDTDSAWDNGTAEVINFDKNSAGTLTITQSGTYVLSGTLNNGQILISAGKKDIVRLVMNGVSVHNETAPAIYAPQAGKVILILADDTENFISDGSAYPDSADEDNPEAAVYIQDNLTVTGGGQLTVTGNYKHGIRAQDYLVITDGVINVTAAGDALRGRDGIAVLGGNITLRAGGDGMQSNNASGFVIISGGVFDIQAENDGIQVENSLTITDGVINIITGGGSSNAPVRTDEVHGGWQRQRVTESAAADTVSMKALKAGREIYIMGGDITIDAEDDGIHSDGCVYISAGKLDIKAGDDGIHADSAVEISGGEINIPVCYEGIEGLSVTVTGGDIKVTAGDDAINAADGSVAAARPGGGGFTVNDDVFIRISGGSLDLYAPYDGIDSNGNVFIEGGVIKISAPSQGMDGAVDMDGTLLITGGELITAGSVISVSAESTQPAILVSYTQQQTSGSVIEIKDVSGKVILEYTSDLAYTMSGFSSPDFVIGGRYTLYIDGVKKTDITLNGVVTSIGDDGGAYSGMNGMGGRMPNGGGNGNWGGGGRTPPMGRN